MKVLVNQDSKVLIPNAEHKNFTETNEVITYTESEVTRFIQEGNLAKERQVINAKELITVRSKVHEFFNSQYTTGDQEITTSVEEINDMLRDIGADELKRTWSATVRIHVNLSGIEASTKDEAIDMIQDDINVELQSIDGDLWVDDIEVQEVIPE
jgi:hypothetical protein